MLLLIEKNIGLYWDDGLSIFRNASGLELEKLKKRIQKIFKEKMLGFIIEYNMKIVDYLDKMIAHTNLIKNETTKRNIFRLILTTHHQS